MAATKTSNRDDKTKPVKKDARPKGKKDKNKSGKDPKGKSGKQKGGGKGKKDKKKSKPKKVVQPIPDLTAETADKYALYQEAVNSPDTDADFMVMAYTELRGKKPAHLREDFCGTAALSAEWISRGSRYTAEGFDIDPEPVEWGKEHNFKPLGDDVERMAFHLADVRQPSSKAPDVRSASNFSYWLFMTRAEMLDYLRRVHADIADDGIFVVDLYGGPESMTEMEEERELERGATYVWDQMEYWPGTGEYNCAIHFRFSDGSELEESFRYSWRLWSLPELRDLMYEVGFQSVTSWFEGTDDDGESGNGEFEEDQRGENCEAWLGYLVAAK